MTLPLLCIAHRGAMGHAPENTLLAIQTALQLGARFIEIDVFQVQGELLVIHDDRVDRTTNGTGRLIDCELGYLRSLDAGQGERIPTLAEVCQLIAGQARLNIEIKGEQTAAAVVAFVQNLLLAPANPWRLEQLLISSFDHRALQEVKSLDARLATAALIYGLPADDALVASRLAAVSLNPALEFVDERLVTDAHARGLQVFVYTVNELDDLERMAQLGVDGVFTNYPDRVLTQFIQPERPWGWLERPVKF